MSSGNTSISNTSSNSIVTNTPSNFKIEIPRFDGKPENYHSFQKKMTSFLFLKGIKIIANASCDDSITIYHILVSACTGPAMTICEQHSDGISLWNALKDRYRANTNARCYELFQQYARLKWDPSSSVNLSDHINTIADIKRQIEEMGEKISDRQAIATLIGSLPDYLQSAAIITKLNSKTTLKDAEQFIREYHDTMQNASTIQNMNLSPAEVALNTTSAPKFPTPDNTGTGQFSRNRQTSDNSSRLTRGDSVRLTRGEYTQWLLNAVCIRCGEKGHIAPQCQHQSHQCSKCNKTGHLEKVCKSSI